MVINACIFMCVWLITLNRDVPRKDDAKLIIISLGELNIRCSALWQTSKNRHIFMLYVWGRRETSASYKCVITSVIPTFDITQV